MTCNRCLPNRPCINCETQAGPATFLRDRDHREALARGQARYERNSKETRGWA